jgi:uncharacterized protein YjbI with pentapeptide repeats
MATGSEQQASQEGDLQPSVSGAEAGKDGSARPNNRDEREAEERIAKLRLEQLNLRQQIAPSSRALEWLKAATAPIALIALLWTVVAGLDQMKQTRRAAIDDRFDKTIARVASQDAYARVTGIAGLRQFLSGSESSGFSLLSDYNREADAVSYLVTALAVERDSVLRDAILDALSQLRSGGVAQGTINGGLRIALERNRKLASSAIVGNDDLNALPPDDNRLAQLRATALAIVALVRQGGRVEDMTNLYCVACDFSGAGIDLSGVNFDRAILREADFSEAKLENSSFDGANILGTRFVGSKMQGAHLTDKYHVSEHGGVYVPNAFQKLFPTDGEIPPTDFTCADLEGAIFGDQILFGVYENYSANTSSFWSAELDNANLSNADLSGIRMFVRFSLPPSVSEDQLLDPEGDTLSRLLPFNLEDGSILYHDRLSPPTPDSHLDRLDLRKRDYWAIMSLGPKWRVKESGGNFHNSLDSIAEGIRKGRNWKSAKLPLGLSEYLRRAVVSSGNDAACKN